MARKSQSPQTVALTGLNTFLGRETLSRLLERGHRVVAIDIERPADLPEEAVFYKVDLTLPTADAILADIFRREEVRGLVHLAFLSYPKRDATYMHELQVIGTLHLLHASAAQQLDKIVVKSSAMTYGAKPLNPNYLTESHALRGGNRYRWVQDMVEVEGLLERYRRKHEKARVISLRFAPILGPTVHNWITEAVERPAIMTLLGFDPLWQLVHEEDAVSAILRAVQADADGPFNVAGSGILPLSSMIYLAGRVNIPVAHPVAYPMVAAMWLAGLSPVPSEHLDYIRYLWAVDTTRAEEQLDFTPTYSTRETLEQFAGAQRLRDLHLAA